MIDQKMKSLEFLIDTVADSKNIESKKVGNLLTKKVGGKHGPVLCFVTKYSSHTTYCLKV